jgi:hypothetical protein
LRCQVQLRTDRALSRYVIYAIERSQPEHSVLEYRGSARPTDNLIPQSLLSTVPRLTARPGGTASDRDVGDGETGCTQIMRSADGLISIPPFKHSRSLSSLPNHHRPSIDKSYINSPI